MSNANKPIYNTSRTIEMKALIQNNFLFGIIVNFINLVEWKIRKYAAPSPRFIKQACLIRNGTPDAIWVETGTYLGVTTRLLSKHASKVYSIEPEPTLFANAVQRFTHIKNVELLNGTSEEIFPALLPRIKGDVNFWLDGHYSAGSTFKGPKDSPIIEELNSISEHFSQFNKLTVLVDDIRCFDQRLGESSPYPSIDALIDWARTNNLHWHIEHDIFIAMNH